MLDRREFLIGSPAAAVLARQASAQTRTRIRRLDIVHHCHTDVGYTDLPSEARDLQRRYIDVAVDACLADKNFRWTVEVIMNFDDWWRASTPQRRKTMLDLIHAGRIDVMALPLNQTSVMNALQWRRMVSWIPDSLWRDIAPRAFMQSDVNGMPRAGAMLLLDRGISRMLMGINSDSGGPPFRRPSAFWWKMPDGRRMFVWLGEHYGVAQRYLKIETAVPDSSEASLRASHASLLENLAKLEKEGYGYDRLLLSYTNPLRWDNGPPVPGVAPFVQAWNKLGLEPELRLTTGTQSLLELEKELGGSLRTLEGEWTDWWLNGTASGPREVAASRFAKRYLTAALSPVWGDMPARAKPSIDTILDDLCIFDEHTWGAHSSVSDPDGLFSVGQYAEKSVLAYRPMSQAGQLLARRARAKLDPLPEGVYVANTAPEPVSGWAVVSGPTLKAARSLRDRQSGAAVELRKQGDTQGRIWVEKLPGRSVRAFDIATADTKEESQPASSPAKTDANGWPVSIQWPGMTKPLTAGALGDFLSVGVIPPADRRTIWQMHATPEEDKREELRAKSLERIAATFAAAESAETAHTWTYKQEFRHPRLAKAARTLELWKREPRARLNVRFDRVSSRAPEVFYLEFAFPEGFPLPLSSCGGLPFTPYRDQLEGTCRDYFGIDGWARYRVPEGDWLWISRDAPLAVVGGPHTASHHQKEPEDRHRLLAMVFDNCWHTNFVADSNGAMEFQFDLAWSPKIADPAALAETLAAEPVVVVNPKVRDTAAVNDNLWRP
jgi:hypothetical protein